MKKLHAALNVVIYVSQYYDSANRLRQSLPGTWTSKLKKCAYFFVNPFNTFKN